ncbi:hypothetical protein [Mycoplana dimorpha]|uniref:Uncharacterized protein n=1 Tax=Mycoplana dimorpha TaxID=28320 RepID=A0A2T5B5B0_MYCDI|nr:hypothetical protein [Mycoplana dimorpha]PTM94176.1 hypothetical protein C7449_10575 [Mycoplana dimorpha]
MNDKSDPRAPRQKPPAEKDAQGQFRKTRKGATNDGVSSAKPRVITGSDDATANKRPPGAQPEEDWDINFDETEPTRQR